MIDGSLNYGRDIINSYLLNENIESVLDLGAGFGDDLMLVRRANPKSRLFAVENYPDYVNILEGKGVTVYPLNIERNRLPFEGHSIDLVIMNQVLEHIKDIFWIFHEISRVLKVGGSIIIGVPNLASFHNRMLLLFGAQPTSLKTCSAHVRGFTKGDLIRFFRYCFPDGYRLTGFRGSNFYPFPPIIAKPLARYFPTMAWSIFLKLEKVNCYKNEFLDYPVIHQLETDFFLGPNENRLRP